MTIKYRRGGDKLLKGGKSEYVNGGMS